MTDQLPERAWISWPEGRPTGISYKEPTKYSFEAEREEYLRADTAVTKSEADAMVATVVEKIALRLEGEWSLLAANMARSHTPSDARAAFERAVREAVAAAKREWALKYLSDESQQLEAIDAAVAAEQERCARIADQKRAKFKCQEDEWERGFVAACVSLAAAIRTKQETSE